MLSKNSALLWLSSFLFLTGIVFADQGRREHFLSKGPGARAGALHQAFTALANDPTALYYNPAGLAFQRGSVYAEHTPVIEGGRYNFIAFHYPSRLGSFGFGVLQFATDSIEGRRAIGDEPFNLEASQTAWYLPYSAHWKDMALGVSIKKIDHDLAGRKDSGLGFDAGFLYTRHLNDFYSLIDPSIGIGLSSKNILRPSVTLESAKERLPTDNRIGLALSANLFGQYREQKNEMVYDKVTLSLDVPEHFGEYNPINIGLEYVFRGLIPIRAGYGKDLSFGLGYGSPYSPFSLDYSLAMTPLEPQHRFSFSYYFTDPKPRPVISAQLRRYESIQKDAKRYRNRFLKEGHAYLEDRKYKEATHAYEMALVLDPKNREIFNYVARSKEALLQSDLKNQKLLWEKDQETITFSQNLKAKDSQKLHDEFDQAISEENIKKARSVVHQAQDLLPDHPITLHIRSGLPQQETRLFNQFMDQASEALSKKDMEKAYGYFLKAEEIFPDNADLKKQMGNFEAYYNRQTEFKNYDTLYQDQLYKVAALYFVQGDLPACLRQLDDLLRKNVIHEDGRFLRAYLIEKNILPGGKNYEHVCTNCADRASRPHP